MRIGLIGTASSHIDELALRLPLRSPSGWIGAIDVTRPLPGVPTLTPAELAAASDAVFCAERDGRAHRERVVPLLAAGLPVFVDKPLATTVVDARAMIDAARGGGRLFSASALRWAPEVREAALRARASGDEVVIHGPADPGDPHGGLAFYGMHSVEVLAACLPGPLLELRPLRPAQKEISACRAIIGGQQGSVRLVPMGEPFRVRVGRWERAIEVGPDYFAPLADAVLNFFDGAPPAVSPSDSLRCVRMLECLLTGPGPRADVV